MRRAEASALLPLDPADVIAIWRDTDRWPAFVDQFEEILARDPGWPAVGSSLTWRSTPAGRGKVVEKVVASDQGCFATAVSDDSLSGSQTLRAAPADGGTHVMLELEYELSGGGAFQSLADAIFIRRALRDSLRRTLERLAAETRRKP